MADNSLLISKYVQHILENSEEIKAILGEDTHRIFPLLQPDELKFPFIVHSRTSVITSYTKDIEYGLGGWYNTVNFTVKCVSNNYIQCLELANAARHSIETYRWKDDDIYIHPIQLASALEYTIDDDVFVQELQFQCIVE